LSRRSVRLSRRNGPSACTGESETAQMYPSDEKPGSRTMRATWLATSGLLLVAVYRRKPTAGMSCFECLIVFVLLTSRRLKGTSNCGRTRSTILSRLFISTLDISRPLQSGSALFRSSPGRSVSKLHTPAPTPNLLNRLPSQPLARARPPRNRQLAPAAAVPNSPSRYLSFTRPLLVVSPVASPFTCRNVV
jgi:hypothetical protein